ncbi:family 27 glycoside hydrolase [Cryphonectria parasitica EP155]|uniref:Alpha-galactosidase n=1 Tax=Cryphonectria parasitica (strain ATCC 38755 / EP155) TaxID=660469 RepID=A0A9P5CQA8_CRYP1|nr:family 27 glycoside hydrolase [Cryphonectria parasitica EP155]KAF3767028.1 family 27 glycoside hydrolase [Cryphonectria parasitica EP155]
MWTPLALCLTGTTVLVSATTVRTTTPVMGWDSYNYYSCSPTQEIIQDNAAALVSLGLDALGYTYVTTDCGWTADYRDPSTGELVWNPDTFPSGGAALGEYIHNLSLHFGVYSGAGYYQCGSTDQPASLGHETLDADSFAAWGADSLKYDNCYANSTTTEADYTGTVSGSPTRFDVMASALATTSRDTVYQVCQWGVGEDIGVWAPEIANSWRISNDIYDAWRSIWRITNQVVPYYKHTGVGAYADMDMLVVGLNALSNEEEKFHFGMWAINKSPLIIGSALADSLTPASSLEVLSNTAVIALNQDSLGRQAQLVRRYTTAQYDIWQGALSGGRQVVALANWYNGSQTVTLSLPADLGIASAAAEDVWAGESLGTLSASSSYTTTLAGHELRLLVLSNIVNATSGVQTAVGYYTAAEDATLAGEAVVVDCPAGTCLPAGNKVGDIGEGESAASVTFSGVEAVTSGTKLLGIDYCNYDVALETAWDWGDNTRNMTIAVNQAAGDGTRFAFPISGGDWYDAGRLYVYVEGFVAGTGNEVIFTSYGTEATWAPDLVGFEVYEVE